MNYYSIITALCFGFAIGVAFTWADHIQTEREHAREKAELAADLNAFRVMSEWDKLKEDNHERRHRDESAASNPVESYE